MADHIDSTIFVIFDGEIAKNLKKSVVDLQESYVARVKY